jgi:hypothetical protein
MRPLRVTTTASVIASGLPKIVSTARATARESSPAAKAVEGSKSPMGHGVLAAGGRLGLTTSGVKCTLSSPIGSGTHPWLPYCRATRVTPFLRVRRTVRVARSTTVSFTSRRNSNGPVKNPTLAAASCGSSPVMNTAAQRVVAKPAV